MLNIQFVNNYVQLRTPFSQKDKCTAVPGGKWVPKLKCWEYLLTPVTAATILQVFPDVPEQAKEILEPLRDRLILCHAIKNEMIDQMLEPETRTKPWHHQIVTYNLVVTVLGLDEP